MSRSGKILSSTYSITESSTVPSRAATSTQRTFSYVYDDTDNLTEIVKEDPDNNKEAKTVARTALPQSANLSRSAANDTVADLDPSEVTAGSRSPCGRLEGSYLEIGADVYDFRPLGIKETFRGGEEITKPIDKLAVGEIFIDEGGNARKIVSISGSADALVYVTVVPDLLDFLNIIQIPNYLYSWDDMDVRPEYMPTGLNITSRDVNAASRAFTLNYGQTLEFSQDIGNGKLSLEVSPSVSLTFDFGLDWGSPGWFRWNDGWGKAILSTELGINGTATLAFSGEKQKEILIYPKTFGTDAAKFQFGLYIIPKLEGSFGITTGLEYTYANTSGLTWVMDPGPQKFKTVKGTSSSNDWSYSVGVTGSAEASIKVLALGGVAKLFGVTLMETYPGAGLYAEAKGSAKLTGAVKDNVKSGSFSLQGSGAAGFFMEGSFSLWNEKWSWTMLDYKLPFTSWEGNLEYTW